MNGDSWPQWDPTAGDPNAGGGFDLGGGLSVDEFGNVTGGMFEGGPGTPGAGGFGGSQIPEWLRGVLGIGRNVTSADVGRLGSAGLGYLGSQEQRQMFQNLADRYWGMGAPYRQRLEQTYADPTAFLRSPEVMGPVQQGSDIMARSLSTQGNPAQSGNAMQQLQNYSANTLFGRLGEYRGQLGQLGGMTNPTQAGAVTGATGSAMSALGNQYNALGSAMNSIFNPPQQYQRMSGGGGSDLGDILKIGAGIFGSVF